MKKTLSDQTIFDTFFKPGEVVEVRIPKAYGKTPAWDNEWVSDVGLCNDYKGEGGSFF